ncbi:MAG TPA: S8 family serine peptidase [Solirubrobacteraceae bacterium]|nr:S8 family serine peptidase [Solirubrobacteraceae bacterium]
MRFFRPICRGAAVAAVILACSLGAAGVGAAAAAASQSTVAASQSAAAHAEYVPGQVVVGYSSPPSTSLRAAIAARAGTPQPAAPEPAFQVVKLRRGETVAEAIARLRALRGVAYVAPNYLAHETGGWIPDDRGRTHAPGGWQFAQWNFLPGVGVNAPGAWSHLFADAAPGGRGVTVAILDTGVAYTNWTSPTGQVFTQSPDFAGTPFVAPCDVYQEMQSNAAKTSPSRCTDPHALDRQGHGTFVAGIVGEGTNNHIGLTGLAWGATLMPVRVLDPSGNGDSATIAEGIRYAVLHGAQVINLSLEFDVSVGAADIPDVIGAIAFAHSHGVIVVAAAGNDSTPGAPATLTYPARDSQVISVGSTTSDRCRAAYSNVGPGLDLVAPGGGDDATIPSDPNCNPARNLPDIFQMTFEDPSNPNAFSMPGGWYGTSMSAPHVAAAAALVIASGILGSHPSPDQVLARLEGTAQPLGATPPPNTDYGYGLLNAGAATAGVSQTARYHRLHQRRHHAKRRHHKRPTKKRRTTK